MSHTNIKMFKLIPIKDFEKSDLNKGGEKKCDKQEDEEDPPKRSINDIIDSNSLENTEFAPSQHYVAEQKFIQRGSGKDTPIWLPNETQLPQFSKGSRIKKSYDDLSTILNDKSLSDDLKVRLYTLFRKKYNNAVNMRRDADDDDDGDNDSVIDNEQFIIKRKSRQREALGVIRDIVDNFHASKKQSAYKLVHILVKNKKHLSWDFNGSILHPAHRDLDAVENMRKFLEIILYRNKGTALQISVVADLIKPFFRDVEQFILNDKLHKMLRKRVKVNANLPQYVSWHNIWNK